MPRKREHKVVTRIGCEADLKVTIDRQGRMWVASAFNPSHNHDLASPSEIQFLRSNRKVPESIAAQAKSIEEGGGSELAAF